MVCSICICFLFEFTIQCNTELLASCGIPAAEHTGNKDERNVYHQLFGTRVVYPLALFALAYCGIEITIGGQYVK